MRHASVKFSIICIYKRKVAHQLDYKLILGVTNYVILLVNMPR